MKVIWILDDINTLNGMVQVVIGLSNHFSEKGHNVRIYSVFSGKTMPFFHLSPAVLVEHLGRTWDKTTRMDRHRLLGTIMEKSDADIMLTCNEWANTSSVLQKRKFRGKLILTQHLSCDNFSIRRKLMNGILHRFADAVAVLTEADKEFYAGFGIHNVTVIPNAIYICPCGGEKLNVLCSVGRVEAVKGFDMLIAAYSQIAKDFPDWKLRIWGDGSQRETLLAKIEELGLSDQIEMPGVTDQVAEELSKSSVFVMSSRWEGFPLALIEAMSSENAIVAFDLPCTKDILSPATGLVVPKNDVDALAGAMRKMLSDELLRVQCGAGARDAARKFNIDNVGHMWLDLFEQLK